MAASKLTCLTPADTRDSKMEPDNQITPDERTIVESKTLSAKEFLRRSLIVPIVNYFDFLLYTQLRGQ